MNEATYAARHDWARGVPQLVEDCARRWQLRMGARLEGGYVSHAFACESSEARALVLKVSPPAFTPAVEAAALRTWNGRGAVALVDFDAATGAMLLERVEPGTPLPPAEDVRAVEVVGAILRELHAAPLASGHPFPAFAEAFEGWLVRARADAQPGTAGLALLDRAAAAARRLNASADETVLLHGDVVDKNLLLGPQGYVAIDPIPRLGDPCEDIGFFAAYHRPAHAIEARALALATALDRDPHRALRWAAVWAVGEGCETWRSDSEELQAWLLRPELLRLLEA